MVAPGIKSFTTNCVYEEFNAQSTISQWLICVIIIFMELHLHNYYNAAAVTQSQKPDVEAHEQHSSWTNIAQAKCQLYLNKKKKPFPATTKKKRNQLKPLGYSTEWRPISSKTFLAYFMYYIDSFTMVNFVEVMACR